MSRIGEVILNPYLGPRLKSGVITTNMPLSHDKPIDFGLQTFCEQCNKCARECPSGAITAGPKSMFNGYEICKSDSQKCTTYRLTQAGGAMCGRCMKTCPWNLEAGIEAYRAMPSPEAYKARLARGETEHLAHEYRQPEGRSPVIRLEISKVEPMTDSITKYEFRALDGEELPAFATGAHLDVVVAPEFFRQYSLSCDPADRGQYQIAVLREDEGRGGSRRLHKIFRPGRKVFVSRPINHFQLDFADGRRYRHNPHDRHGTSPARHRRGL